MNSRSSEITVRSSERHFSMSRIVSRQFAQASSKRTASEPKPNFRHLFRSSEMPVAQAKSAKPVVSERRSSERQASLKRGTTWPSSFDSLKRDSARLSEIGPERPYCVIFQSVPNPKPKLSKMIIRFIKNCLDGKNYIMKLIMMGLCMLMCK